MVINALIKLLDIVRFLILARVIISWLPIGYNRFIEMLYTLTEPILAPIRNLIHKSMGDRGFMIDFSPIVAFLLINLIQKMIVSMVLR